MVVFMYRDVIYFLEIQLRKLIAYEITRYESVFSANVEN